jgi:hypothetical protein
MSNCAYDKEDKALTKSKGLRTASKKLRILQPQIYSYTISFSELIQLELNILSSTG